jgi:hypothetical protein
MDYDEEFFPPLPPPPTAPAASRDEPEEDPVIEPPREGPGHAGFMGAFSSVMHMIIPEPEEVKPQVSRDPANPDSREHNASSREPLPSSSPETASDGWGWGWPSLFGNQDSRESPRVPAPPPYPPSMDEVGPPATASSAPVHSEEYSEKENAPHSWLEEGVSEVDTPTKPSRLQGIASKLRPNLKMPKAPKIRGRGGDESSSPKVSFPKLAIPNIREISSEFMSTPRSGLSGLPAVYIMGCVAGYTRKVPGRCPCCCAFTYMVVFIVVIVVGMLLHPMEIETDFGAFMKTDTNSSRLQDTFSSANAARRDQGRRLQGASLFKQSEIYIAYELKDDVSGSIFDPKVISEVSAFEKKLQRLPKWVELCDRTMVDIWPELPKFCNPGISLVNYVMPSLQFENEGSIVPSTMTFDGGGGGDVLPLATMLREVEQSGIQKILLPNGFDKASASSTRMFRVSSASNCSVAFQLMRILRLRLS